MHEDLEVSVQIGQVLATKYRVDRILGAGGMGVVVAATHLQLDQMVALKFIRREALLNAEVVSRFEREARAAVRLKSEHVARIIDVGRLTSGSPYIVMEYLEGQDLAALLHQHRSIAVPLACDYIIQACDAISEAHHLGIVHRDLKPGNLFLTTTSHGRETIKVLDFGISKSHGAASDANMTRTQAVMGSPGYMSPEQMRSTKNVDGRTDVWSLGVILYELVSGRMPFHADTFTALCVKIAMDPLPPLGALPAMSPPGFETVVQRALEKDPSQRYPSAVALAQALAPFANALYRDRAYQLVSLTTGGPADGSHLMPTVSVPRSSSTTLRAAAGETAGVSVAGQRSRIRRVAGIGAVAIVTVILGFALLRGPGRTAPAGGVAHPEAEPIVQPAVLAPSSDVRPSVAPPPPSSNVTPVDAGVVPDASPALPPDAATGKSMDRPRERAKSAIDPFSSPD